MKQHLFSIVALLITFNFSFGQDFQGTAIYESKTSLDLSNFGRPDMSEDQKKRIKERIKRDFEKTFILSFNTSEAMYLEEKKLEQPGNDRGGFRGGSFNTSGKYYKNIKDGVYVNQKEILGRVFLIKDELPKLVWKMGSETKQIGQYACYKATAKRFDDPTVVPNFKPPGREEDKKEDSASGENKKKKEVEVTAWYTLDIPLSQGPGEYSGLPGFILEINTGKTTILCSKIILNSKEKITIEAPKKGKEISQEKYNEILKVKMEELSELRRNRRGSGGGNRSRN